MSDFSSESNFPTPPPPPNMSPPGYVAYGGQQPGGFGQYVRVGGQARALRVLLYVYIPVSLIGLALLPNVRNKANDYLRTGNVSDYNDAIGPWGLANLVTGAIQIALIVLTMIWMHRLAKNLQMIGRVGTWSPGWAIGGWFLPPFLFVIPYLMFRDLWKGSEPDSGPDWKRNAIAPIVHIWWVLYGVLPLAFITVTINRFDFTGGSSDRDTAKTLADSFGFTLGSQAVSVLAAVAYVVLISQLTKRHTELTRES